MGRGVDMRGVPSPNDGVQFVGGRAGGHSRRRRPAFMEGLPPRYGGSYAQLAGGRPAFMEGVPPRYGGSYAQLAGGVGEEHSGMRRRSSSQSSFPIKDDAGYIGYLSDDESGSGDSNMVSRRRRELLGSDSDVSFSSCLFMMITVCGLLMLFLFAVSPWGIPPPRRL